MNIRIIRIADPGVVDKERLFMKVVADDNTGGYIVFDTVQTNPGKILSRPRNVYWFPDREVKSGDSIVLYTKGGVDGQREKEDGTTTFFFYWDREKPLWNRLEDSAVLLKIESWEYKSRA